MLSHIFIFLQGTFGLQRGLLTTQQVFLKFHKNGADQMSHPNDTLAAQDTLLYINIRGCNFLCKLGIPTGGKMSVWLSFLNHPEGISSNCLQRNYQDS